MAQINIKEEITDVSSLTDLIKHITEQIGKGFTNGYYPTWELILNEEESKLVKESVEDTW